MSQPDNLDKLVVDGKVEEKGYPVDGLIRSTLPGLLLTAELRTAQDRTVMMMAMVRHFRMDTIFSNEAYDREDILNQFKK
ncbi:unnamed protein product [Arctia plantaginis]|uniref:Uncharacterized protein n=1 Tax=Arctia plantaginis TaxID=874455 RepID=A0A8S1A8X5_ARCPL|nr:unnamed protein product [Arctia plantaginis]